MDFLEAVYKLSDKPYVIVGLHFDQVSLTSSLLYPDFSDAGHHAVVGVGLTFSLYL